MSEWQRPGPVPDGLSPPGEQLVIPWETPLTRALDKHVAVWSETGWACSCGRANEWPPAPIGRARGAVRLHLRGVARHLRVIAERP